jgi:hypothetical protein
MCPVCAACGLDFHPEHGSYVGAMYVRYLMTAGTGLAAALLRVDRVPLAWLLPPLAAFGLAFPVVTFRWSRALWLGIQRYVEERTTDA